MQQVVVVHFAEVALKGRNKPFFVRRLMENLRQATLGTAVRAVRQGPNRVFLWIDGEAHWEELSRRIGGVPGVKNFSLALSCPPRLEDMLSTCRRLVPAQGFASFRMRVQRSDKSFPMTSKEVEEALGAAIKGETGARVDLSDKAEATFYVEILPEMALCYREKLPGPGGLPVGVSGRVLGLISGGIDSPVAAYRVMKRGCRVTFVHFHAFPYLDSSTIDKTTALVGFLTRYQYRSRLYLVPFGDVQRQIVLTAPVPLRVVLYRRLMMRIAEAIAHREGALALVTGDSLGQVASQTLENLVTIGEATSLPILRPLVGMDKDEIVAEAQRLGTYPTSIEPDQDCCQLFVPPHPSTRATVQEARAAEDALDVATLVEEALARAEMREFRWPEADGGEAR
ncbi:MAG TPA: tRNA uracil 4-sulfurtransferase ThiI [Dehalococcoidia bacterium]|nr:tRNA uracil 4-sulfurtransferase ThiI [Dehalococcoidia bacterium]